MLEIPTFQTAILEVEVQEAEIQETLALALETLVLEVLALEALALEALALEALVQEALALEALALEALALEALALEALVLEAQTLEAVRGQGQNRQIQEKGGVLRALPIGFPTLALAAVNLNIREQPEKKGGKTKWKSSLTLTPTVSHSTSKLVANTTI
jgi:hypothetical protein